MPEKEKIYSRQVSAPILKRKTSRFGLGQFLGSSSGNQNTSTASHSVPTASNTLHTRSKALPPCPVHHSQQHTAFPYHQHPHPHTHTHHPHSHPHPYPHTGSSAQVATFATAHSQSHQYLVHCVPPSHHSPLPTLQEAETLLRSKAAQAAQQSVQQSITTTLGTSAQQHGAAGATTTTAATTVTTIATAGMTTSSTGASTGHNITTSFHSHFQKHPSAPNLLPPQPLVTAPSPSPSALAFPMHCTCDAAQHPSANASGPTGSTTANPGRL